jgi:hypothetical protein
MNDLPEGFQLDAPAAAPGGSGLPEGFQLDNAPAAPMQAPHPLSFTEKLERTWPAKLAKTIYGAVTLPGDVLAGKVDPLSPEAIGRSADIAQIFNPAEPGVTAGRGAFGAIARPREPVPIPANVQAAQAALEAGTPLPRGIVSPNPVTRATTKAAEQLPFIGPMIGHKVGEAVAGAGERVGEIATELRGGTAGRADVGETVRPGIDEAIQANNDAISEKYSDLRSMIDPQHQFEMPQTKAVLDRVLAARSKKVNPQEGLGDVINLTKPPPTVEKPTVPMHILERGGADVAAPSAATANFAELQRVRSDFGRKTKFGEPNPGFNEGERQALYGAMSNDMENGVRQAAVPGTTGEQAVNALKAAHDAASDFIDQNAALYQLSRKSSNEGLAGSLIGAAADKTGNIALLRQLRAQMPPEQFQTVSGQLLSELGHSTATNGFSLDQFTTNWNKLSPGAKAALFEPEHQTVLDGIAKMGQYLKTADKYRNTSNTAHGVGLFAILEHLGESLGEAATGNVKPLIGTAAGAVAGLGLGKLLARPASASAIARWTRAAQLYNDAPSIRNRVLVNLATKGLIDNVSNAREGISHTAVIRAFGQALSPQQATAHGNKPTPQGGAVQGQVGGQP